MITTEKIEANHTVTKRLGNWTTENDFQVRANRGLAVLDLRSPQIADGDIHIDADIDHAVLKLLVAEDAVIDDWDLQRVGRGRIKDLAGPNGDGGRRIVLTGRLASAQVRVHRGGIAILSAMFSRAYVDDVLRANREGDMPTVDDPTRVN